MRARGFAFISRVGFMILLRRLSRLRFPVLVKTIRLSLLVGQALMLGVSLGLKRETVASKK